MDLQLAARIAAAAVVSYLVGGISWAYIIGKRFYGIDVRVHGSGNLGATNVFRTLGAKAAIATLVLDVAKGAAAVGFAWWLVPTAAYGEAAHTWAMITATMAAIVGHSYSPYIGFKGGKGIATAAGALLVLTPYAWPFLLGIFVIVVAFSRIVSLGSVMDAIAYPFLCLVFYPGNWAILGFACVAASLVVWRHRSNIVRIARGEEPKVSFSGRGSAAREKKGDT
jgi:acyl phosphate:glycerol-3-phosphate acyltransferase